MISFQSNAGPYLQYAFARVQSIFRKGGLELTQARGPIAIDAPEERTLGLVLVRFGEVVHQAADAGLPHLISDHLYELAKANSGFFEACPVLKAEGATRDSRLALCALTARQLRRGLGKARSGAWARLRAPSPRARVFTSRAGALLAAF